MSHYCSISKQDSPRHCSNHNRSARRQATNCKAKIGRIGVKSDQHPDGGEWRICYLQAPVAFRNRNREHSNLKHPTEFYDNLLAI